MKKIISLILVLGFILIGVPSAYASPCCELYITEITQFNDVVTVHYSYMNNYVTNREILMRVKPQNDWQIIAEESHYVSEWLGEGSFSFSSRNLLHGSKYTVSVNYTKMCDNYYCSSNIGEMRTISIEGGKPVWKFESLINGRLDLIGESTAYVSFTAAESGFYSVGAVKYDDNGEVYKDNNIRIYSYPDENYVSSDSVVYMSAGQKATYSFVSRNGSDLSTNLEFISYEPKVIAPITTNLQGATKVFTMSGLKGINEINIPKYGMYKFSVSGCDEDEVDYTILNGEGYVIDYAYGERTLVLEAGTYYINTMGIGDGYTLDVTYVVPETVEFGKSYTLDESETAVFRMNVEEPSVVTFEGDSAVVRNENEVYDFYSDEMVNVIAPGEYFVTVENYSYETISWSFTQEKMPSISLDVASKYQVETTYRKYVAFCAPESGEYEVDFSNCYDYYIVGDDNHRYVDYYKIAMEKGEWILIVLYSDESEITVRKYVEPTEIALEFDKEEYFNYCSGKTYLYSFTPSEDGAYKVVSNNNYCDSIKIYTGDEVLYKSDNCSWTFSKILNMKKDVKVYIELSGISSVSSDAANDIKVTGAYTEITNGETFAVSTSEDMTMCYTAEKDGFYEIKISVSTGGWSGAEVMINDNMSEFVYSTSPLTTLTYCKAGEKIYFTFYKYGGSWCDMTVNINEITPTAIEENVETSLSANAYYSFVASKDSIYKIDRDARYGSIMIVDNRGINLCMNTPEAVYFNGVEGETYVMMPYVNMNAQILSAGATSVTTGKEYSAEGEAKVFEFKTSQNGFYKIETSLCNAEIYVWGGDYWYSVSNTFNYMHKIKGGIFPILYLPKDNEEGAAPSAQFKVTGCADDKELGVSIDDLFMDFSYNGKMATAHLTVTAPYDVQDIKIGVEYSGSGLSADMNIASIEMVFSDVHYIKGMLSELEEGRTYNIKPYIYVGDDYENRIYGEEKSFTVKSRDNIKKINSNSYTFKAEGRSKFDPYTNTYFFKFTQPANASGSTFIGYSLLSDLVIYNAAGERINSEWDYDGITANLEGGETYYLKASVYYDGIAEIAIESLPEMDEPADSEYSVEVVSKTTSEIKCKVSGSGAEDPGLYAAFYHGKKLVDIMEIEELGEEISVYINAAMVADNCKLFLVEKGDLSPLCKNEEISLK